MFFFLFFHQKVSHAQHPIPQVWHIKFDCTFLLMCQLSTPVHVLRNTISESTVLCHIQINLIRIFRAVFSCFHKGVLLGSGRGGQALGCSLLLFAVGFGAAYVAAFVLAFRVIRCPSFLFGAAFGFDSSKALAEVD